MTNCKNCNTEITDKYCPHCGQRVIVKRIDGHYIIHEIEHILHFEKGILYTIKELLLRPGKSVRLFISDDRNRLVKPIIFIIITSLIYTLINHFFHIEEGYMTVNEAKTTSLGLVFKWIQEHYGYANIMMGICIAFWTKLFFRKYEFNFYEILILLCFVIGMAMLFYSLFALLQGLTHIKLVQYGGMIGIAYSIWAIGQFFNRKNASSYFKAFAAYLLGMLTFLFAAVILAVLLDLIVKH